MPKAKTKVSIILISILLFYSSCYNRDNSRIFTELNNSLLKSKKQVEEITLTEYRALEEKTSKPVTAERATVWFRKAGDVKLLVGNISGRIEHLKNNLNLKNIYPKDNELFESLQLFEDSILRIDSAINKVFYKQVGALTLYPKQTFIDNLFSDNSKEAIISLLTKFQSDITLIEYSIATYCGLQVGSGRDLGIDKFGILVGQNTNHLRTGDELIISAGVGAYSSTVNPTFRIDGKLIKGNTNSLVEYKINPTGKSGKHSIPVKITFTDANGIDRKADVDVEYTIDN
jgi:hypothetical protein